MHAKSPNLGHADISCPLHTSDEDHGDTIIPIEIPKNHTNNQTTTSYMTGVQDHLDYTSGAVSLNIGCGSTITRWGKSSVLTFDPKPSTFRSEQDCQIALDAFNEAAKAWNELNLGITIRPAKKDEQAVFHLIYLDSLGNRNEYARAFLPTAQSKNRNVLVFAKAFEKGSREYMTNVFYHEIGHILGLRHEFADQPCREPAAVRFGPKNNDSVMNYFEHPSMIQIHQLDKKWVRAFYDYNMTSYLGISIIDISI